MTLGPAPNFLNKTFNFRLAVICAAAASVGLSMVVISFAKLLLVICGLGVLLTMHRHPDEDSPLKGLATPIAVLTALLAFALSLLWTIGPPAEALGSLAKYGKLLMILLIPIIVRNRSEAAYALAAFVLAQTFLLASSWMLFAKFPVPWATSKMAATEFAVFSSYLDQGIISAVFAAVCWHFRGLMPGRFGSQVAIFMTFAALANVLFVLSGRSGHIVAITLVSIAIMWELPKKYRMVAVLVPFLVVFGLISSSSKVKDRLTRVQTEIRAYSTLSEPATSTGIRLDFWRRALQTMEQHPLAGTGIGSWSTQFNRLQREQNPAHVDINSNGNPHQEYLMWGAQLGIPGLLIFLALLLCYYKDTLDMRKEEARAAQSTLAALAVACLFNSSIYDAQIGDFFCILLGLLLALNHKPKSISLAELPHQERPA